jgi:hypothetical protein
MWPWEEEEIMELSACPNGSLTLFFFSGYFTYWDSLFFFLKSYGSLTQDIYI